MTHKEAETLLKPGERLDELQRNGYLIIQNTKRFCFGMDAVLLTGFARIKANETVLDLGTGTGIIPILLEAKTKAAHFAALEIQPESADMARRSVRINGLEEKITVTEGDIKEAGALFGAASFDVVTTNPPYMINDHGLKNPDEAKAIARHEVLCSLEDIVRETAKVLKPAGRLYMVHRPFRLAELIRVLSAHGLELKRLRFVHPYVDKEPNMVLMECVKGAKPRVSVEPPLIVFTAPGVYHEDITGIYGY